MLYKIQMPPINLDDRKIAFRECIVSNFLDPPYIVSGANSDTIVVLKKGNIRSIIKPTGDLDMVYSNVILRVEELGNRLGWGNVFPYSVNGLHSSLEYVRSFGDWEVQVVNWDGEKNIPDVEFVDENWVPDGYCVVVVKDKSYLGDIHLYGDNGDNYSLFVHNPGRAVSLLKKTVK